MTEADIVPVCQEVIEIHPLIKNIIHSLFCYVYEESKTESQVKVQILGLTVQVSSP
jgi:hypothetical protein